MRHLRYLILLLAVPLYGQFVSGVFTGTIGTPGGAVNTPTDSPGAGTYGTTQSVTLSDSTSGATICYTIDGSTPGAATPGTCDGSPTTTYSTAISVASTTTIKAIGTKAGSVNSGVLSSVYTISPGTLSLIMTIGVGGNAGGSTTPSTGCSNSSCDTTGANKIVVGVAADYGASSVTMTDNKGNTYALLSSFPYSLTGAIKVYLYCANASTGAFTVGTGHTFTFAGSSTYSSIGVVAVAGADTSECGDQQNGANQNSGATSESTGNITPSSGSMWVSIATAGGSNIPETATPTSGTTSAALDRAGSLSPYNVPLWMSYKLNVTATPQQETWTWTTPGGTVMGIGSFK